MRRELIQDLMMEARGPRNGAREIKEGDFIREYITGVIVPTLIKRDVGLEVGANTGVVLEGSDDDSLDDYVPAISEIDPNTRPSSFGLSFAVDRKEPEFDLCFTFGRYVKKGENVAGDTIWERIPKCVIKRYKLKINKIDELLVSDGEYKLRLVIRRIALDGDRALIMISIVNLAKSSDEYSEEYTMYSAFQPSLRVKFHFGQLAPLPEVIGEANTALEFAYRGKKALARGFLCSAIWKEIDYASQIDSGVLWPDGSIFPEAAQFFESDVRSEFLPLCMMPAPIFDWEVIVPDSRPPIFEAIKLSEMWDGDSLRAGLSPLSEAYERWIEANEKVIKSFSQNEREKALELIKEQKNALKRIKRGIDLLGEDEKARLAFCFANKVIDMQNHWKPGARAFNWRPFQLAFILMNVESIAIKDSPDREILDLLWVPTGGGKTEAYLGLMAFAMAHRRLVPNGDGQSALGTAILTRYTLRLLTVQQFRRTLQMVTAAEMLRVQCSRGKTGWRPILCESECDMLYGSSRFSIGLWVGGSVTPNALNSDWGAIKCLEGKDWSGEGEAAQVMNCPVCGEWLAVPEKGVPGDSKVMIIAKMDDPIRVDASKLKPRQPWVRSAKATVANLSKGFATVTFEFEPKEPSITPKMMDELGESFERTFDAKIISFRGSRPGYFPLVEPTTHRKVNFAIHCVNPECPLNNGASYIDGTPITPSNIANDKRYADGLGEAVLKIEDAPFEKASRIPIPAYTVDEQIYSWCPTIVVSTADKIARLSFEPRAGNIFGNVNTFNDSYGNHRSGLLPKYHLKGLANVDKCVPIDPFSPPELVIQDELHLIDGPLGSMFGLYELMVDGIIFTSGRTAKYIASTATTKNAEMQVDRVFARKLSQFPAMGIDADDSFFVKSDSLEQGWKEKNPSRAYLGVYAPGTGNLTTHSRLWARLLQSSYLAKGDPDVGYYWTLVGYCNSIRGLGSLSAIYREDVIERLTVIGSTGCRNIDPGRAIELSGRIDSTDLPQILNDIEKAKDKPLDQRNDALFTTSMFGTGVDVPYLSLMVMDGQPKTTSQYIQASGRVGRSHGGLIAMVFQGGKPRDLSHYEIFAGYHQRIYANVEPSSVSPYSTGCMERALGPAAVAFLRNIRNPLVDWAGEDGKVVLNPKAQTDIDRMTQFVVERLDGDPKRDKVVNFLQSQIDHWKDFAGKVGQEKLKFNEYSGFSNKSGRMSSVVLGDSEHDLEYSRGGVLIVFRNAPQSLREVEETLSLKV